MLTSERSTPCHLALVDVEPALRSSLTQLLSQEGEFLVLPWQEIPALQRSPDILVVSPARPERLAQVRRRFPAAYILARVSWDRSAYWNDPNLDERLDELAPFPLILSTLRRIRDMRCERTTGNLSGPGGAAAEWPLVRP